MNLKPFKIAFAGLKDGKHEFTYDIDNTFFEEFGFEEFNSSAIHVVITMDKRPTIMDLDFIANGIVNVHCDLTNEPFDLPIQAQMDLVVKFGQQFNDENESLLILEHGAYEFYVSQYIYEMIVLAVPAKRVHPGIADGTLQSDIVKKLEELKPKASFFEKQQVPEDPRWDILKKLKTDNNNT